MRPYLKERKKNHKIELVEWLKCSPWVQTPVPQKKKKRRRNGGTWEGYLAMLPRLTRNSWVIFLSQPPEQLGLQVHRTVAA
jgi:hypothetical protein